MNNDKWIKFTDYALKSGKWTISKKHVDGVPVYSLWDGNMHVANFDSAEKSKVAAK